VRKGFQPGKEKAMTEGVIGLGTLLKIGDGATPEVFTAIAEVKDITGPGLSQEFSEFTQQQSSRGYREYKPTFKNSGDVAFKCNFLPDDETQGFSASGLLKDYEDGTLRNFELLFPDPGATKAGFCLCGKHPADCACCFRSRTQRDTSHHRTGELELDMSQLTIIRTHFGHGRPTECPFRGRRPGPQPVTANCASIT
jgi:hypothetical protein